MIAEVKRQPRSNRRLPPLDNARDKPEISYLVFFPETGYADIMLIIRDRQVFPNSSCVMTSFMDIADAVFLDVARYEMFAPNCILGETAN